MAAQRCGRHFCVIIIMINSHQEGEEKFPTLFGFKTDNKVAAQLLNTVYGIVMFVAMAFAYHALSLILVDWPTFLILLASIAVVGLPYCIKIIMYGRKVFDRNMAILCIAISLLPTMFDFIGFYSETSIRESLRDTKFEVLEKVNYFDKDARNSINENLINLDKEYNANLLKVDKDFNSKNANLNKQVVDAEQNYIDETQGISGRTTTGKVGVGPKARALEAEIRKTDARIELEQKELTLNKEKEIERLSKDYETKRNSYESSLQSIDDLVSTKDNKGLIFEVNKAKTFNELTDTVIKLNTNINTVSSKLGVEPEYVKFSTDNVIELAFGALLRWEITAVICLALALLLEVVDTIIVYMVRGVKNRDEPEAEDNEEVEEVVGKEKVVEQKAQLDKHKKIVNVR